jgi:hypothetical protein
MLSAVAAIISWKTGSMCSLDATPVARCGTISACQHLLLPMTLSVLSHEEVMLHAVVLQAKLALLVAGMTFRRAPVKLRAVEGLICLTLIRFQKKCLKLKLINSRDDESRTKEKSRHSILIVDG